MSKFNLKNSAQLHRLKNRQFVSYESYGKISTKYVITKGIV